MHPSPCNFASQVVTLVLKDLKEFMITEDVEPTEWTMHTYISMETQMEISLLEYKHLIIHKY